MVATLEFAEVASRLVDDHFGHPGQAGDMAANITKAMAGLAELLEAERKRAKACRYL